jgi:plastocyanin
VAGCGGDDGSGAENTTTTETTETTAAGGTLQGEVGPGFDISMAQSEVAPGTYELSVDDKASSHNFHLTGPGVDVATDVAGTGPSTFTVTLQAGTYTFVCDPHAGTMNGSLTVQ